MKKVLHIQFTKKAAGSCAWRLHEGMTKHPEMESKVLTLYGENPMPPRLIPMPGKSILVSKVNNRLHNILINYNKEKYGMFTYPILGSRVDRLPCVQEADIIYVHWVQLGFLSLYGLKKLIETGKTIYVFMHDMWYITGGCHNALDCSKFMVDCKDCPIFKGRSAIASRQLAKKTLLYASPNVHFISPSIWLKELASVASPTREKTIHYIPNYFDSPAFREVDKQRAKQDMGIAPSKRVISFGAVNISSPYKGWVYLQEALGHLASYFSKDELLILVLGEGNEETLKSQIPFEMKFLGYIDNEESIAKAYQASDIFVIPSIADNQPTMVIESLCCGIPVVGFKTGGIPDMISHKENGYLADYKNSKDLAEGMKYCLDHELKGFRLPAFLPQNVMDKHSSLLAEA